MTSSEVNKGFYRSVNNISMHNVVCSIQEDNPHAVLHAGKLDKLGVKQSQDT